MRLHALRLTLWLAFSISLSHAARISFSRHQRGSGESALQRRGGKTSYSYATTSSSSGESVDLSTVRDLLYIANITIADTAYPVQIDTGSSDLWVKGSSFPLSGATTTSLADNMTYGIGWAYGNVSYAEVEFAGIEVKSQAFMDVSSASNPALAYGAVGIIGLGFDSLSNVDALVNRSGSDTGRTFLYNAFAQDKSEPNFISFSLQDIDDTYDDVEGYFSIGEYEPEYSAVANSTTISTWPESYPKRWSVLLDYLLLGADSTAVPVTTSISGAPSNRAVVVLDSGTSYTYVTTDIANTIFGNISNAKYDDSLGQWALPCDSEVDIALQFGEDIYPIDPLDITVKTSSDSSQCLATILPDDDIGGGEFDWLIGDNMLRSVYAVYDFGDYDSSGDLGDPYIKLLSLVNADTASVNFHKIRGGTAQNITYNAANVTAATSTTVSLSSELADTLTKLGTYLPAVLALMAFNAFILLALVIAGIVYVCRRNGGGLARPRRVAGRTSPMPMNSISTYGLMNPDRESHVYQPVSMALTDDAFTPPSPAFSKPGFEVDKRRASAITIADRPMSVA
ncbi:acid protease [Laetiporus sulphureus 93-53]|uniref:Acid protease n=1 Tax=Laetiporus sulphureus 93-53 TaxID=1314785 RepID=A0A165I9N6_9APHY|nr:acid protease [Laetiporus sulphureus 93-53]KZT12774.1 acid protease [Laetiporus sulphureus 93-53]